LFNAIDTPLQIASPLALRIPREFRCVWETRRRDLTGNVHQLLVEACAWAGELTQARAFSPKLTALTDSSTFRLSMELGLVRVGQN
jgi:hypothetical protein